MSKYFDLVNILDKIRTEAPDDNKRYFPKEDDNEKLSQARARAFMHLYLKVKFGLIQFVDREVYITDDTNDAGIDGYYVDKENKIVYFIQSKFRTTEKNFESKEITFEELLSMDVERILKGELAYEDGAKYNSKILKLIRTIQNIDDLPNYEFRIVILANIKLKFQSKLSRIAGDIPFEIYDYDRCYNELVFPLVAGTFYNVSKLKITLNLNKANAYHAIDYTVDTQYETCNIKAFFVPTLEIAKIVSKYKNSILKYNPRSYLDMKGNVNSAIANSINNLETNEFALYNNGITMLSNGAKHSDKTGKANKAEVIVTNPQIINGGQTAYTLSILYENSLKSNGTLDKFTDKEVLVKIISFTDESLDNLVDHRLQLIQNISKATNDQTPIMEADRRANDKVQIELQERIFKEFGLYYERKRGEFGDGLREGYIDPKNVIDREQFVRTTLAAQGKSNEAQQGQHILFSQPKFGSILPNINEFRKYVFAYKVYQRSLKYGAQSIGTAIKSGRYALASVVCKSFSSEIETEAYDKFIDDQIEITLVKWSDFESYARNAEHNRNYFIEKFDTTLGVMVIEANWTSYFKSLNSVRDLNFYFK